MDKSLLQRVQRQLREQEQRPTRAPITAQDLHKTWNRGNARRPVRPNHSVNSKCNIVDGQRRWARFCDSMGLPDWKLQIKTISYENRGLIDAFIEFNVLRAGARVENRSTLQRYLIETWAVHRKYTSHIVDPHLKNHAMGYVDTLLRHRVPLRTEPKQKNHIGPDAFLYLSHFRWVRDWKVTFNIGLDRLDDATIRQLLMFTGGRRHEFVYAKPASVNDKLKEYYDNDDAYTADEADPGLRIQKDCWVCGRPDNRTVEKLKVLCWEDIELWIIQDPYRNGGRDRFAMTVPLRFHKGHNRKHRPTKFLFIEEDLAVICPVSHIIAKARAERVVEREDLFSSSTFFRTRISLPGVRVAWKKEFWHVPVFRQTVPSLAGFKKSDEPLSANQFDNSTKAMGHGAGVLDLNSYDYRRGNLEAIRRECNRTVLKQIARHENDDTFQDFYNNARVNVVTQDAFLGRGTKSPYLAIFNQIGLQCDENAPTRATDDMMRAIGPSAEVCRAEEELTTLRDVLTAKYGRPSQATGADEASYKILTNKARAARQKHRRNIAGIVFRQYFENENDKELDRQMQGIHQHRQPVLPVVFTLPERRRVAEVISDLDDQVSEEALVERKIEAIDAWVAYAWKVEVKEPPPPAKNPSG